MTVQDFCKGIKIPSKEIKARVGNGQIRINGLVVRDMSMELGEIEFEELGEFVFWNWEMIPNLIKFGIGDIKDFFGGENNIEGFGFMSELELVSVSKREHFVIKRIGDKIIN